MHSEKVIKKEVYESGAGFFFFLALTNDFKTLKSTIIFFYDSLWCNMFDYKNDFVEKIFSVVLRVVGCCFLFK